MNKNSPLDNSSVSFLPTEDAVTLGEAQTWLSNWKEFITPLYAGSDEKPPMGVFIPKEDILAMAKFYEHNSVTMAGVRGYYVLKTEPQNGQLTDSITMVLVPVDYAVAAATTADSKADDDHTCSALQDIVQPIGDTASNPLDQKLSVFDVVRPCPPCCGEIYKILKVDAHHLGPKQ